ncbi:hypothetical protein MY04_0454 [Flammeovirga sp. MY04]|uniref:hypothetical protein n=1 Tax=Flammeovirga sp. MY04 TaxID=1191459 RepID=UPI0008063722|nr:hypothetical protein [Flammeovirga sp. MY04]ANQ47836.1 hypothetical protein MY04_0454 [Flammeovirga sp. MY04]
MTKQRYTSIFFYTLAVLLWLPILFFDSTFFAEEYFDGKPITSISVLLLYIFLFKQSSLKIKYLMLVMVPLSWLGELLCCVILDMYDYRGNQIPLYVPIGHACIFSLGWHINQFFDAKTQEKIKKVLTPSFLILFTFIILYFQDTLSFALGILFFWALRRKNYSSFYLIMSCLVLWIEIVGTALHVWKWDTFQWIFQTINPPIGAMFIYIGGDMILGRLCRFLLRLKKVGRRRAILNA